MHSNIRRIVTLCAAALVVLLLAAPALAQTGKAAASQAPIVVPKDGRMVTVEGLAPDVAARLREAVNRRLPRDIRTYQLGEAYAAVSDAIQEVMAAGGHGMTAAKGQLTIDFSLKPLTLSIHWQSTQ